MDEKSLRLLLIEDSPDDEFLILRELRKAGFTLFCKRVESRDQMLQAFAEHEWDLIITDYRLPRFSGAEALQIYHEHGKKVPFIVLSGIIGEDVAVEMMRSGAHDYIMKNNMPRLSLAVEREMREYQLRMEKGRAEQQVARLSRVYQVLSSINQTIVRISNPETLLKEVCDVAIRFGQFAFVRVQRLTDGKLRAVADSTNGHALTTIQETLEIERSAVEARVPAFDNRLSIGGELHERFRSCGVFPLIVQAEIWGTVTFFASEQDFFTTEETILLQELANDLSFALEVRTQEAAMRETERFLLDVTEVIPGMVYKFQKSKSGYKFTYLSPGIKQFDGLEPERVLQKPSLILSRIHRGDWKRCRLALLESEKDLSKFSEEFRVVKPKDGVLWFLVTASPQRLADGIIEWTGIAVDITARKQLGQDLEREQEMLAVTLQNIADGVIATDARGRIILMNKTAQSIMGLAASEVTGRPLVEVFPSLNFPDTTKVASVLYQRADGQVLYLECTVAVMNDTNALVRGNVMVIRDVSQREKIEERLRQSEKMESIGLLAGGIAHDFNNLLTGVFGFIQLAKMNVQDSSKVLSYLESALNPFNRARNLTQQLLTFAKGGQPLKKRIKIHEVVRGIVDFTMTGSSANVRFEADAEILDINANETQISQVFENLVLNAKQVLTKGGNLVVRAFNCPAFESSELHLAKGDYVSIEIEDDGPGIAPEVMTKIFDPFFTTKKTGTGLGLSICYSIVKKHGGAMEVSSVLGKGTLFRVYLPAVAVAEGQIIQRNSEANVGQGRVLFLDDEEYARSIAASMLEKLGYVSELYARGEEILAAYESSLKEGKPFDVVILDLTIKGGIGGVEVLTELKRMNPRVKAIASSGYSTDGALANPMLFGFSASLPKPFSAEELADVIAHVLNG